MIAFSIANNFSIDADAFAMVSVFVVKVVKKEFCLTQPWVALFLDSRLYQSLGSLKTCQKTCASSKGEGCFSAVDFSMYLG